MASDRNLLSVLALLFFSSVPLCFSQTEPAPAPVEPTIYDVLPKFGLPSGIFPANVKYYSISPDGKFAIALDAACYVDFEYTVYYDDHITGKLNYGSITDLTGVQAQKFYLWFDVSGIRVDLPPADSIYFQVGFFNKKLDIDQFETVHTCRDDVSGACGGESGKRIVELPRPAGDELPMLKME